MVATRPITMALIEQSAVYVRIDTVPPLRDNFRDVITTVLPALACPTDGSNGPVFTDRSRFRVSEVGK
jgi:hypothetical protein